MKGYCSKVIIIVPMVDECTNDFQQQQINAKKPYVTP